MNDTMRRMRPLAALAGIAASLATQAQAPDPPAAIPPSPDPASLIAPTPALPGVPRPATSDAPAAPAVTGTSQDPVVGAPAPTAAPAPLFGRKQLFGNLERQPDEFALVNDRSRLSFHKPMYLLPATYSNRYTSEDSEFVFQLSLKLKLFGSNFFFAYTQRSYWQIYDAGQSRPFRESNYNPELFYRWKPRYDFCPRCGADFGAEHESNGQGVPDSRSWNRLYAAIYHEWDRTLIYAKAWWRIPEDKKKTPDDPKGDDNPDIEDYLGYGELRIQQELFAGNHLAALMLRGNPATGKGAVELDYSVPFGDFLYWNVYVFNGYGDSLIDYDRSVTRVGVGVMLAR